MNLRHFIKENLYNFYIAIDAVMSNKIRSVLTALGIIFGVAAVISMLAIGNGAQDEILKQIKLVGVNNIVITPTVEKEEDQNQNGNKKKNTKFSPGLTLEDAKSIKKMIYSVHQVSPEIVIENMALRQGVGWNIKLVGVTNDFFNLYNFYLKEGNLFNEKNLITGDPVCIIGKGIQTKFFSKENAIGKMIKCGNNWLTVIGVLEERKISENAISNLGIRDYNMDIYTPIKTILLRYRNRALVTGAMLNKRQPDMMDEGNAPEEKQDKNYHQLDKLVVQVKKTEQLTSTTEIISRLLKRRHLEVVDFEISVPELLLKQQQKTKDIFNIVLGAIAGISLVVGGIGIMNIMLASVMERIKEIGLRLAIGATKQDIVVQFLCEAVFISLTGGLIGVMLGVIFAKLITQITDITTIITFSSVLISFGVSASIGLIFGIMPARKAALQDPIKSLRYE